MILPSTRIWLAAIWFLPAPTSTTSRFFFKLIKLLKKLIKSIRKSLFSAVGKSIFGCYLSIYYEDRFFRDQFRALLKHNFERHYGTNRAPRSLSFDPSWLIANKDFDDVLVAWMDFILTTYTDVFFVTESMVLDWMINPVPLQSIRDFQVKSLLLTYRLSRK